MTKKGFFLLKNNVIFTFSIQNYCLDFKMSIAYGDLKTGSSSKINTGQASVSSPQITQAVNPNYIVQIHVACKNLPKLDLSSQSDPMVVLFINSNNKLLEVDRTEVIFNNPNPQFVKFFQALYIFEINQPLHFKIYDVDSEKSSLDKHDYIGSVDTTVQRLIAQLNNSVELEIQNPKLGSKSCSLILTSEVGVASTQLLTGSISVSNLKKMRTFSKNSPFFMITKPTEWNLIAVYRSEVIPKAQRCSFKKISIPIHILCNGDLKCPITISVMDYLNKKPPTLIGKIEISVENIIQSSGSQIKIQDTKGKNVGIIQFNSIQLEKSYSFIDYLQSGLQLNLITAIDFTGSNGDPRNQKSLHYINPNQMNQYETCIYAVGNVLCPYDTDQLFAVFGFEGVVNGKTEHCFPLTFDPDNPCVFGLYGILQIYPNAIYQVHLSGPTLFAQVIKTSREIAIKSFQSSRTYIILLILTDGEINDLQDTID
jgi:hypothetical protein